MSITGVGFELWRAKGLECELAAVQPEVQPEFEPPTMLRRLCRPWLPRATQGRPPYQWTGGRPVRSQYKVSKQHQETYNFDSYFNNIKASCIYKSISQRLHGALRQEHGAGLQTGL